ncbi:nucleotide exchange factor GrpE [Gardnerella vaginalis]|uniref:nucleotide exchange factor GrpE n=1 Tax=Gardnerella vaginalis TaxID=2702 RepID=UPI00020CDDC1|nr:nucleotide exchange factor GrpE [Gardnerella vaginalis]AEF31026.1 co-chaperone GrpE [Gardnerella vaginalis HMP9231]RIY22488.1 nucleotide exchange factor GrpE [Gardnerella vaginalis]CRH63782.1 grpE protein [Chlamydia trachomatis]
MSEFNANDYLSGLEDVPSDAGDSAESPNPADSASEASSNEHVNASQDAATHEAKHAATQDTSTQDVDANASADAEKSPATDDKANASKSQENNDSSDKQSNEKEDSLTPLGKAKKEAAEYLEALQRERAEFINFRNRASKEQDRFRQHGIIDVLTALLPALDDIDRIREHSDMDDSFKAVAAKLDKAFEKFGVEKFGEKGEEFDPTKHDAILHKPDPDATKDTVDVVVEAGYRIGDRVIRAARVVVASPASS